MRESPANMFNASLPFGRKVVSTQSPFLQAERPHRARKRWGRFVVFFAAIALSALAHADPPDISAQRLLSSWQDSDSGMKMFAEVIASAFASGFSWGGDAAGKRVYCAPPNLKGAEIMSAFEEFLRHNPQMAEQPYGAGMAGTLSQAFHCTRQ
jgi:hypothetical protein